MCGTLRYNHVVLPLIQCECGGELSVHRSRVREIQKNAKAPFEVAKYMLATILLMEQGSGIPENFGPLKTHYDDDGEFHITLDLDQVKQMENPSKISTNKSVPVKKRATLRDAAKSTAKIAKNEPEVPESTDPANTESKKAKKPKKKHQGKSKTFKRKTKRPGRV